MIKLCIDCKHLLQEDDMRWCARPGAGYDINPVDGSKQGGPENHPNYEMAYIERQADFRCGTEGRYFVAKVLNDSKCASKLRTQIIDSAVKDLREFGYPKCNQENIFTDYVYSRIFIKKLQDALQDCGDEGPHQLVITQLLQECGAEGKLFIAKVWDDVHYYRDTKQRMLDEAVEHLHELGHLDCNAENIFINPTYKKLFATLLRNAIDNSTISNIHRFCPMQGGIALSWLRDLEATLTTDA